MVTSVCVDLLQTVLELQDVWVCYKLYDNINMCGFAINCMVTSVPVVLL